MEDQSAHGGTSVVKNTKTRHVGFQVAKLQDFVDVIPDPAVICGERGAIVCANVGARELLGEYELGTDAYELVDFIPSLRLSVQPETFVTAARSGVLDMDLPISCNDGRQIEVWLSTSRLRAAEEEYFVLVTMRDVTERKSHEETLRLFSMTDELTRLHNRRYLRMHGGVEMERATRYGFDIVCVFIDLDDFKEVNDKYGHRIGDQVLLTVAGILTGRTRQVDLLCRFGGDEFVLIGLVKGIENAKTLVDRVSESPIEIETSAGKIPVSLTCGAVYTTATGNVKVDDLVDRADKEMIAAKRAGKGRGFFFDLKSTN
jgi:diguanylate cyclase (GGDEF)-like protein/PAS domain S-box-containing protein